MTKAHIETIDILTQDDWSDARQLIQAYNDELACLINDDLHHAEGDASNASYWSGQEVPDNSLEEQLDRLYNLAYQA